MLVLFLACLTLPYMWRHLIVSDFLVCLEGSRNLDCKVIMVTSSASSWMVDFVVARLTNRFVKAKQPDMWSILFVGFCYNIYEEAWTKCGKPEARNVWGNEFPGNHFRIEDCNWYMNLWCDRMYTKRLPQINAIRWWMYTRSESNQYTEISVYFSQGAFSSSELHKLIRWDNDSYFMAKINIRVWWR